MIPRDPSELLSDYLDIDISTQTLAVVKGGEGVKSYRVSTAKNGPGELRGSGCTPTGWHQIRAKIGSDQPLNSVFIGRRPTGEIYSADLAAQFPERDWILSRIMWLNGLEPGKNRYGEVDTGWRYIYIHGCPEHCPMGQPESHGCIRMHNDELLELFDSVIPGMRVFIHV